MFQHLIRPILLMKPSPELQAPVSGRVLIRKGLNIIGFHNENYQTGVTVVMVRRNEAKANDK